MKRTPLTENREIHYGILLSWTRFAMTKAAPFPRKKSRPLKLVLVANEGEEKYGLIAHYGEEKYGLIPGYAAAEMRSSGEIEADITHFDRISITWLAELESRPPFLTASTPQTLLWSFGHVAQVPPGKLDELRRRHTSWVLVDKNNLSKFTLDTGRGWGDETLSPEETYILFGLSLCEAPYVHRKNPSDALRKDAGPVERRIRANPQKKRLELHLPESVTFWHILDKQIVLSARHRGESDE